MENSFKAKLEAYNKYALDTKDNNLYPFLENTPANLTVLGITEDSKSLLEAIYAGRVSIEEPFITIKDDELFSVPQSYVEEKVTEWEKSRTRQSTSHHHHHHHKHKHHHHHHDCERCEHNCKRTNYTAPKVEVVEDKKPTESTTKYYTYNYDPTIGDFVRKEVSKEEFEKREKIFTDSLKEFDRQMKRTMDTLYTLFPIRFFI